MTARPPAAAVPRGLAWFNGLEGAEVERELLRCCAAPRWAETVARGRPYADAGALLSRSAEVWFGLGREEWLEAFATHPRIGEAAGASPSSRAEQAAAAGAPEAVRAALAEGNREYERRFGHVFLICASGRGAEEVLNDLKVRLGNDAGTELEVCAREQAEITRLRLRRLVDR